VRVLRVGPAYPYSNSGYIIRRQLFALSLFLRGMSVPKPDVIEGSNFISYLPSALVGSLRAIPHFATYHECWIGSWIKNKGLVTGVFGSIWERLALFLGFDAIIAVSGSTKRQLAEHDVRTDRVIPNGVSLNDFKGIRRKAVLQPTVCYAGRLVPGKRVDVLLRAASIVAHDVKNLRVVIIGDGPERRTLEALAKDLGVNAEFRGFIKSSRVMRQAIASSTVFCLPSEVEGFGIMAVEAMACGVPVVVAGIPSLREITSDGKAGLVVAPGDAAGTAAAIERIIKDKKLATRLVKEGRKRVAIYNWDAIAKDYEALLRKVMA
jgi:glycosyltransferase involved in cell wall biosynthesis